MTLKFFLGIRIDLNQIKSNPVFLSLNQIELKHRMSQIESSDYTCEYSSTHE